MSETEKPTRIARRTTTDPAVIDGLVDRIVEETERRIALRPNAVALRSFDEIVVFCDRVTRSNLCPKDFKGRADDAIIAVMMGQELGLPAMASLQSIAVVNGRPTLWGDAVPGLCMQTGRVQDVQERFEGEPGTDAFAAVCIVTRKGMSPREGRFSAGDVRQAGLKNTHLQYPKDMMMWRARHRAWHGAFPDTLKGMGTAEIEQEAAALPPWPMPKPEKSWFEPTAKPSDGHDMTWLNGFSADLSAEPNAWKWMTLLVEGLAAAPTLRDVDEIEKLPMVAETTTNAPEEAKNTIAAAFNKARDRFAIDQSSDQQNTKTTTTDQQPPPPAQDKPTQAAETKPQDQPVQTGQATKATAAATNSATATPSSEEAAAVAPSGAAAPEFSAWVLDQGGEPVELYSDPVSYADHLRTLYHHSENKIGLLEQNADGMQDAEAASAEAKAILDEFTESDSESESESAEDVPSTVVVEVPIVRGTADWKTYMADFKAALGATTADTYLDFIAANQPTLARADKATRLHLTSVAVKHANTLGVPVPAILAEQPGAKPTGGDKDQQAVANVIAELKNITDPNLVTSWMGGMVKVALRERLTRENKGHLVQQMLDAQTARMAELRAGA